MKSKLVFKIKTLEGHIEVPIKIVFKYRSYRWIVHRPVINKSGYIKYKLDKIYWTVSEYSTGVGMDLKCLTIKEAVTSAKQAIDERIKSHGGIKYLRERIGSFKVINK